MQNAIYKHNLQSSCFISKTYITSVVADVYDYNLFISKSILHLKLYKNVKKTSFNFLICTLSINKNQFHTKVNL
jgi:hypothetical protein